VQFHGQFFISLKQLIFQIEKRPGDLFIADGIAEFA